MASTAVPKPKQPGRTAAAHQVLESDAFRALVRKRWTVSFVLLATLFVSYYGFILVVSTQKEWVSQKVGEVTTLAIPLGVGAIVIAWALTAIYVGWANAKYDPEVERLKNELRK